MSKIPIRADLVIYQNRDFYKAFYFYEDAEHTTPLDISSWTFKAQLRVGEDVNSDLLADFAIEVVSNEETAYARMHLTPSQTGSLPVETDCNPNTAHWDMYVLKDGAYLPYFYGRVQVKPTCTEL